MIPQPIVSRSVSRAISAATPVEERASIPCLRHHGYASASQIVSIPASSIARADASISSSGSIVSCMTPIRNGGATQPGCCIASCTCASSAREDVLHLLVHDRLQDALAHRADRPEDLHLGAPRHRRAAAVRVGERERRLHVHDRADAVALDRELRELRLALLDLLHVDLHLQAAEAERDLHVRRPVPVVVDVEALDAGHRLRHRRRVVQHLPDRRARRVEVALAGDVHAFASCSSRQTRWYGLWLSVTTCAGRVLDRGADRVDPGAAALAHALRAERRERRRALDRAGRERRHVERVRDVVVVEVGRQQVPVLVVLEGLVDRGADRLRGRAHHLALDDLRVDPLAAVVDGGVVDDLVRARLRVDLDDGDMDLRRVREREVAELLLDVRHLERRPVDVAAVERDVEILRQPGVVRVDDRAARHEREERVGALLDPDAAVRELERLRRHAAEDGARELLDLGREHLGRALHRAEAGDRELARVRAGEAGVRVPVAVVAGAHVHVVERAVEDVGDDLRRGRLVALPLRRRAERDDDLAEDVELDRRDLVVARELELGVDEPRLAEVVRAGVERRADPDAEQLPALLRLPPARPASVVVDQLERDVEHPRRSRRSRRRSRSASRTACPRRGCSCSSAPRPGRGRARARRCRSRAR